MKNPRSVALVTDELEPPPDRGRLLDADEVWREILHGKLSPQWVKRNVKGADSGRVKLGHSTVLFYEHTVRRWIAKHLDMGVAA